MTTQVQAVVRLDEQMARKLEQVASLLAPQLGKSPNTSETIRAALEFTATALPHIAPVAARIARELGVVQPLALAVENVMTSGVQGAHREIDRAVEQIAKQAPRLPKVPALHVIAELTNVLGSMLLMPIQAPDGRTVLIKVRESVKKRAQDLLKAQQPNKTWPDFEFRFL